MAYSWKLVLQAWSEGLKEGQAGEGEQTPQEDHMQGSEQVSRWWQWRQEGNQGCHVLGLSSIREGEREVGGEWEDMGGGGMEKEEAMGR